MFEINHHNQKEWNYFFEIKLKIKLKTSANVNIKTSIVKEMNRKVNYDEWISFNQQDQILSLSCIWNIFDFISLIEKEFFRIFIQIMLFKDTFLVNDDCSSVTRSRFRRSAQISAERCCSFSGRCRNQCERFSKILDT